MTFNQPAIKVEIAFNAGWTTPAASRVWTDVSAYVEWVDGLGITFGRQAEVGQAGANQLTIGFDNTDARFTPSNAAGPYYPNVKIGRPIRVTATPPAGAASTRVVAFIDEWPTEWPSGSALHATSKTRAASRLARLGAGKKLGSLAELAIRAHSPSALWPLTEAAGSPPAHDELGGPPMSKFGGVYGLTGYGTLLPALGQGIAAPTDGLPTVKLPTPPGGPTLAGLLRSFGGGCESAYQDWSSVLLFSAPATANGVLFAHLMRDALSTEYFLIGLYNNPGEIQIWKRGAGGSISVEATLAIAKPFDAAFHTLGLSVNASAGTADAVVSVYIDGTLVGSPTVAYSGLVLSDFQVGQYDDATASDNFATVGRCGLWRGTLLSASQHADIANALLEGYLDELPGNRIERYAGYAGIAATEVAADDGVTPLTHVDTEGKTILDLARLVETTEDGVLFDAPDGALTFHARSRRYAAPLAFTLSIADEQVEADVSPKLDRTALQNDVTASTADGTTVARAVDQASVDEYGPVGDSLELHTTDENEPHAAAWWRVNTYAEPSSRLLNLTVDLYSLSTALQAQIFAATVGTRIAVTGWPASGGPATQEFFIEGWSESISPTRHTITFNVSPAEPYTNTWVLQDPVRGQLDAGFRLAY